MTTVTAVTDAFDLLYRSLHDRTYRKSLSLHKCGERELLPIARSFLLGYFGKVMPELACKLPGSASGTGRVDFCVDGIAIEFAVRKPLGSRGNLSAVANAGELKKLLKYDGRSLLVLFDFSKKPFTDAQLDRFRDWPSLGKGNHKVSAFNVAYFYIEAVRPVRLGRIRKIIRVC
ncbi:hypothetical protein LQ772_11645 [Frateuria edaphi]|uniref:hypothetical protein n=1 Tax=Frateuria edaphi TaxID=2898793 RepID=UPI001E5DD785|nr:hypothetical protein [Frateuria edaphi]UGB44642.1 hypothetical protein LQ772_11645 [Frateuria edaphi]